MKIRTHDFYFFHKQDHFDFIISILHLKPELQHFLQLNKPGLLRIKMIKSKLEK